MPARSARLLLAVLAVASFVCAASRGTEKADDLQARFDHETNSVHKAKLFERVGDEQFATARHASQAGDFVIVGQVMEKYRDNARVAMDSLKKDHPNAEHQMGGYKQLQIHIHRALRELDDALLVAPFEFKPPLQLVRRDLLAMDNELLLMLFPSRTGDKKSEEPNVKLKDCVAVSALACSLSASPQTVPASTSTDATLSQPDAASSEPAETNSPKPDTVSPPTDPDPRPVSRRPPPQQQKDYLSELETDKIRDAETTNERLKLFITFAEDRLKKFQYELEHPSSNKHGEMLNALMNGYVGCVDDAADLVQLGIEKQENIRLGVDLMASKTKEFLDTLNKIASDKVEIDVYKDNLDDAIEGTRDAMNDAEKAKKKVAPPPVRRKP